MNRLFARLLRVEPEHTVFLGLGSNLGDRMALLQQAVGLLDADPKIRVDSVSSLYETEPVGGPEQSQFLNVAVRAATTHTPGALLSACQSVEARLGRQRSLRWGPRTIDVDVLLYADGRVVDRPHLQVPHPRLAERAFALIPLMEVAPGQALPDGRSLSSVVGRLAPITGINAVGEQVHAPRRS